jgi:hypothetical protein
MLSASTTTLGARRPSTTLAHEVALTASSEPSTSTLSLRGAIAVVLEIRYQCGSAGRTLNLYPEVLVDGDWLPASDSVHDTSAAAVDASGYLPVPLAPMKFTSESIDGATLSNKLPIALPEGIASLRVSYSETNAAAPASTITVLASPVYPEGV